MINVILDGLRGILTHLFSYVEPSTVIQAHDQFYLLVASLNVYVWFMIVLPAVRFQLPAIVMWFIHLMRSEVWVPPPAILRWSGNEPLVSVLIAGRNEADTIGETIKTVLGCGYTNLEIIFVDDHSDDGTVAVARRFERTGRVKIFASASRNGKPSSLNIAIAMARGQYFFIVDADSDVQFGTIHELLLPMRDPRVAAVAANIRVRNATTNLVTRLQECEYALNVTLSRAWRAKLGILSIVPGAGGMFRASVVRTLGGFDTGLGDDTDLTLRIRKAGWKLGFAPSAVVWTNVPESFKRLFSQRSRWERNMVKIRLRKQRDLFNAKKYGRQNMWMMLDLITVRMVMPMMFFIGVIHYMFAGPFSAPIVLTHMYWLTSVFSLLKLFIANDIFGTPRPIGYWLVPLIPFYRMALRIVVLIALLREFLRIKPQHGYVPDKIWNQAPQW